VRKKLVYVKSRSITLSIAIVILGNYPNLVSIKQYTARSIYYLKPKYTIII